MCDRHQKRTLDNVAVLIALLLGVAVINVDVVVPKVLPTPRQYCTGDMKKRQVPRTFSPSDCMSSAVLRILSSLMSHCQMG